jgi:predicted GNAT family acetyltransferase
MELEIKHKGNSRKGSFYIEDNGILAGEMVYIIPSPEKIVIEHTLVSDIIRGHGAGNQLVDAIVSYARDNSFKISSVCSFAKSVLDKTPAYHDVYTP